MAGGRPAVQVTGAKELRRALTRMGNSASDLRDINLEAAREVSNEGHQLAPRRSGRLAGDIRATATKSAGRVLVGRKTIPYAGVIHFGWPAHNIAPNPFLYDALDRRKTEIVSKYEHRIEQLVRRVGQETPP